MDSPSILDTHRKVLRLFGLWPPPNQNTTNYMLITLFYFISISFLTTLFLSILFINSTKQVVDNLIVSSSSISAFLRGIIFFKKYSERVEMFEIMHELDEGINSIEEVNIMKGNKRNAHILFKIFLWSYCIACSFLGVQSLYGKRDEVFWSSTTLYPNGIADNQLLYWVVFLLQAFGTSMMTILSCILDTYTFMIIMILNGHSDILARRLASIGMRDQTEHIDRLKKHVKTFLVYLR